MSSIGLPFMRGLLTAGLASVLAGCAACPPIRAAWYRVDQGSQDALVMALVNVGAAPVTLTHLAVNPTPAQGHAGWLLAQPPRLAVGEMRVFRLDAFRDTAGQPFPRCRVPVRLALQCPASRELEQVALEGALPNYLPDNWLSGCAQGEAASQP